MAFIVETGNVVPLANSYISLAEARAYAADRGITTLPADDDDLSALLIKATDYIEGKYNARFKGERQVYNQALSWPRYDVWLYNTYYVPINTIPVELKNAQAQLACDGVSTEFFNVGTGREVIREKVDVIEREFSPTGAGSYQAVFRKFELLIAPLLKSGVFLTSARA